MNDIADTSVCCVAALTSPSLARRTHPRIKTSVKMHNVINALRPSARTYAASRI